MKQPQPIVKTDYKYGFHKPEGEVFRTPKGLSREVIEAISHHKNEPDWMRQFRLNAFMMFEQKMMPNWVWLFHTIKNCHPRLDRGSRSI